MEAKQVGAPRVLHVHMSFDEIAHAPRDLSGFDRTKWKSEVLFVGTWMPERGPFLARLVELGVPLTIRGNRWSKAKEWPLLENFWQGPGIYDDEDYAKAIQCAKVSLGLLSKGNRDQHTQRSMEIPFLQGLLCAERTREHESLYREDEEAVFWSSAAECADKCTYLLGNETVRQHIAERGRARALKNQTSNQSVMAAILETAFKV
jgi:spore maturation protein CgeB